MSNSNKPVIEISSVKKVYAMGASEGGLDLIHFSEISFCFPFASQSRERSRALIVSLVQRCIERYCIRIKAHGGA